jgi:CHASE3 domain sensor protein
MSSSRKAKIALALALLLLCLSGIAAGFAIARLYRTETLVRHTYDVEVAIGDVESSLTDVGRTRADYINSATSDSLMVFEDAVTKVGTALAGIRKLIGDNPAQLVLYNRLESTANHRMGHCTEVR